MENLDTTLGDNQWVYGTLGDAVTSATSNISLNKIKEDDGPYAVFGARGYMQNVSFFHQENDYLAIIKDGAGIGRVSELPAKSSVLATMQYLLPKTGYELRFIKYFLESIDFDQYRTGSTIPHIYFKDYKSEPFPILSITEQQRIIAILDEVFADIEQVRAKTEQNLKNARELFESYLQQVFSQQGEGWDIKQVSDIADTVLGKMLDKKKNKGTFKPYLRNLNVQWFDINTADLLAMRFEDSEYERYSIKKGDLVICEGGYPGRGAIWNNEEDIFFQKALHRVRSHKSIYNRWILYYLYLSDKNGELKKSFTGAGIQHFTGKALKALKIPVPTESMANKYIEKIDQIFNEVQLLENNYIRKLAGIDELKKSILQKAFSGELTKKNSLEVAHD